MSTRDAPAAGRMDDFMRQRAGSLPRATRRFRWDALRFQRRLVFCLLATAGLVIVGCATTASTEIRPTAASETLRFEAGMADVPAPPSGLQGNVADAWESLRQGNTTVAEQALATLPAEDSGTAPALTLRGFVELARGSQSAAGANFQRALEAQPDFAPALYGLGFVAEASGAKVAAMQRYLQALETDPTLAEASVRLRSVELAMAQASLVDGEALEASGSGAGAMDAYREAIRLGPDLLRAYLRLAALYGAAGDDDEAVRVLRDARNRVGDVRQVLEPLGLALQRTAAHADAYDVFQRLREVAPNDPEVRNLVAEARRLYETTSLPEPYRRLEEKPVVQRADLASLIAIRLPGLEDLVESPRRGLIMTDIDDSWAAPYIRDVVEWDLMQVYQNHAFYPDVEVSRQLFAEVSYRILELLGAVDDAPRPRLVDVPRGHFFHDQIQIVVGRGILQLDSQGRFGILDRVSGEEAIAAMQRLARLARERGV
jgi:tetratricopeptide (TPR) repeat protein